MARTAAVASTALILLFSALIFQKTSSSQRRSFLEEAKVKIHIHILARLCGYSHVHDDAELTRDREMHAADALATNQKQVSSKSAGSNGMGAVDAAILAKLGAKLGGDGVQVRETLPAHSLFRCHASSGIYPADVLPCACMQAKSGDQAKRVKEAALDIAKVNIRCIRT
jgi:hypothetical protein